MPVNLPAVADGVQIPMARSPRQLALDVAYGLAMNGTFYSWSGDDPAGMDCSGMVTHVLKSPGTIPRTSRFTAQGFYDLYSAHRIEPAPLAALRPGMLVFWKRPNGTVRHIEMVFDLLTNGTVITIGASGGGPNTKTLADAIRDNAFVQLRPLAPGWAAAVDPFGETP